MIETLNNYYLAFLGFPKPVRKFIYGVVVLLIAFTIGNSIVHYLHSSKIERLERENKALQVEVQTNLDKATKAEAIAKTYEENAKQITNKIASTEAKEKIVDEKIISTQKTSSNLKTELNNVRVSEPANVGTIELENKLRTRYGQANSNK